MELTGVHILLTLRCTSECDHCFVFGSPRQRATMPLTRIREVLAQAHALGTVEDIYFEGGEPFLFHAVLVAAATEAAALGFAVGVVSNAFWATAPADARTCLGPLARIVSDLSLSRDRYHSDEPEDACTGHAEVAAAALGIPTAVLSIAQPEACATSARGMLPAGEVAVMFRGRAAETLAPHVAGEPWQSFDSCPHEELAAPERVHVDPSGHVHVCQGITIGNLFEDTLAKLCHRYRPADHPIVGPLLAGGPAELWRRHGLVPAACYADACHACDAARRALRERFPAELEHAGRKGVVLTVDEEQRIALARHPGGDVEHRRRVELRRGADRRQAGLEVEGGGRQQPRDLVHRQRGIAELLRRLIEVRTVHRQTEIRRVLLRRRMRRDSLRLLDSRARGTVSTPSLPHLARTP